jgi:hypothetical protein
VTSSRRFRTFLLDSSATREPAAALFFPVTWKSLSTLRDPSALPAAVTSNILGAIVTSGSRPQTERVAPAVPGNDHVTHWEMVVPKMVRPSVAKSTGIVPPQSLPAQDAKSRPQDGAPAVFYAPSFGRATASDSVSVPWRWSVIVMALLGIVTWAWIMFPGRETATRVAPSAASPSWVSERAMFVVGTKQQRQLLIYQGSQPVSDFRAEFDWKPDQKGAGLVFRCVDRANYQALRIGIAAWQPVPTLYEEHFAVLGGIETEHRRKIIPWNRRNAPIHFSLDVTGFAFTLSVQGSRFDYWTDQRLKNGDIGFFMNRNEQLSVEAVRFTFANHAIPDFSGSLPREAKALLD